MPGKTVWHSSHDAPVRSASIGIARAGAGRKAAIAQTPALTARMSDAVAIARGRTARLLLITAPKRRRAPKTGRDASKTSDFGDRLGEGESGRWPIREVERERGWTSRSFGDASRPRGMARRLGRDDETAHERNDDLCDLGREFDDRPNAAEYRYRDGERAQRVDRERDERRAAERRADADRMAEALDLLERFERQEKRDLQSVDERYRSGAWPSHRLQELEPSLRRFVTEAFDHRSDRGKREEPEDDGRDCDRGVHGERVLIPRVRAGEKPQRSEKIDRGMTARRRRDGGDADRPRIEPRLCTAHIKA